MNRSRSTRWAWGSATRRIDDGCTVAVTGVFDGPGRVCPRCLVTRKSGPRSERAAVAPKQTTMSGATASISANSQGRLAPAQASRRSVAQRVNWWRVDSWSLRRTAETWLSTVLVEMDSSRANSL